jgi:type IV pilus assembly protein PilE
MKMQASTPRAKTERGFTLIEVMVVVAIIGILATIAYPSYTEQIAKGRRSQARVQLLAAQQWMERFYSENYRYDKNSADVAADDDSQFKARFTTSPPPGEGSALYDIALVTPLARDTYTIRATRTSGTTMAADKCGDFTIDSMGRKSIASGTFNSTLYPAVTDAIAACWN